MGITKVANSTHTGWPVRPWFMAIFLAVAALAYHFAIEDLSAAVPYDRWRLAIAVFIGVGALSFAFTFEPFRWHWSLFFSVIAALVMSGVAYWNGSAGGGYRFEPSWSLWSGLLAVMIAAPLLQNLRDEGRWNFVYEKLHNYSWTDVVIFFTSLLFVGITFMLMNLLASLLNLIGLDFLKELLRKDWFGWLLAGASFGAALGILRENDHLLIVLQKLVLNILSILAPVLATGLVFFLFSLPFTGLETLWESTRNTTPILLSCAVGALILSNAIIRNHVSEITNSRILKISALLLAITILPLSMLSAYSMWLRLAQYGLTPDRIWGFIVILVAVVYGLTYLLAVVAKRNNWAEFIRPMNIKLAGGLCLLAVFLALPFFDFGQLSAQNQIARLNDGRTSADKFDFTAMAFDFGPAGRKILEELADSDDKDFASSASTALSAEKRWDLSQKITEDRSRKQIEQLLILPNAVTLPDELKKFLYSQAVCNGDYCILIWEAEAEHAMLINQNCGCPKKDSTCQTQVNYYKKSAKRWEWDYDNYGYRTHSFKCDKQKANENLAAKQGDFSIREVTRRQVFAGDTPIGEAFD